MSKSKRKQIARIKVILWDTSENKVCALCGSIMDFRNSNVDHIIPKSKGGCNDIENLQLTHIECNRRKGNNFYGDK